MESQRRPFYRGTTGPAPWVTPDAVELDLATATVGSRGVAYMIDLAIIFAGLLVIGLAEVILGVTGFVPGWAGLALLLVFAFTLQFGYPVGFEVLLRGRTPGKAAMGLRVVTIEGLPVGFRHATVRAVIGLLELTGTFGIIAIVASLSSARGQRLGDMAAGTVVLRERRSGGQPTAMTFSAPLGTEPYVVRLDVSGLGNQERAAIRDTLRRMEDLPPAARAQVVGELAEALAPRTTPPPPDGMTAEVWLRCVAAALQRATAASQGMRLREPSRPGGTTSPLLARPTAATRLDTGTPAGPASRPEPSDQESSDGTDTGFAPPG